MIHQFKTVLCKDCLKPPFYCWLCNSLICNLCNQEIYAINNQCKKEICLTCFVRAFSPLYMSLIKCPNCQIPIYIESISCMIFRCGVFRSNGEQIPPHASKTECEFYVITNSFTVALFRLNTMVSLHLPYVIIFKI